MSVRLSVLLLAIVVFGGCRNSLHTKARVQEAILERLRTRTGLDLQSLDVTTTAVNFDNNLAYATVAFHPKDNPNVTSATTMKYTLREQNGKWVVVNVADSQGHGMSGHPAAGADALPPGHPTVPSGTGASNGSNR